MKQAFVVTYTTHDTFGENKYALIEAKTPNGAIMILRRTLGAGVVAGAAATEKAAFVADKVDALGKMLGQMAYELSDEQICAYLTVTLGLPYEVAQEIAQAWYEANTAKIGEAEAENEVKAELDEVEKGMLAEYMWGCMPKDELFTSPIDFAAYFYQNDPHLTCHTPNQLIAAAESAFWTFYQKQLTDPIPDLSQMRDGTRRWIAEQREKYPI